MKKSLFFVAAASALMLTACSSEDDVLQSAAPQKSEAKALGFDVYMPQAANVTRAGDPKGVMTTEKLKTPGKGFGVMAFYQNGVATYAGTSAPNFMYNEHVSWNNGWSYSPLKYWPNETTNDSQDPAASASQTDKLSFFAYAPYVSTGTSNTLDTKATNMELDISSHSKISAYEKAETSGILRISSETYSGDPKVEWGYTTNLENNVDLLWGVAPAGFSYTNVSGTTTSVNVGMPLTNLVKPDKDQKVKFLFQHALSRIGLSVVSAIDQIAAGDDGNKFTTDPTTKVLIKNVQVFGDFGKNGVLNLNNTVANKANWIDESIAKSDDSDAAPLFWFDNGVAISSSAPFNDEANSYIAPDLRYVQTQIDAVSTPANFAKVNTGVLPSEQPLLAGGPDPSTKVGDAPSTPAFAWDKTYYYLSGSDYVLANITYTNDADLYTYDATADKYTQVYTSSETSVKLDGKSAKLYKLPLSTAVSDGGAMTNGAQYYKKTVVGGKNIFTIMTSDGTAADAADTYYPVSGFSTVITGMPAYASKQYWTALLPRYFMVIPTGSTPIKVKITYAVVTKDEKLTGNVSNVENDITKTVTVNLENGKSYNLKLILSLTSVKLDATVADWQVADDAEVYLPKNN